MRIHEASFALARLLIEHGYDPRMVAWLSQPGFALNSVFRN